MNGREKKKKSRGMKIMDEERRRIKEKRNK
jgi:hypothetical protein